MSKLHSRPTQLQMKTLVELMSKDPLLCAGKFTQTFTQKSAKQKWEVIAEQLNALPGAEKSWDKWKKTWQDTRSATKTKAAAIKRHIGGTGGGPTCAIQLNDIQQDALLLMSPASVSGHSKSKESNVEFIYEITENDVTLDTNDYIIEEVADIESDDENNNHSITSPKLIAANNKQPIIAPFSPKSDIKRKMTTTARLAAISR
ncbi:uncharacterized protein LOC111027209 [Myzus persicae]|uniref:uncharacterized protein LOC111027209 n=1 Tax=Myzus persicae TaxID=13164 RepID=UPI000B935100|nr:uncharacterized protein LOC111027209 [Myzus persicae]